MPDLIYLLAVLVCPITMGAMMLMMMRGSQRRPSQASPDEVARLRAEVDELRAHAGAEQPQGRTRAAVSELIVPLAVLAASGTMTWFCCVRPVFRARSAAASGERFELSNCCAPGSHVPGPPQAPGDIAGRG